MSDLAASDELMDRIYRHQRHVYDATRAELELTLLGLRAGALAVLERPFRGYAQYAICRRRRAG